MRKSVHNLIFLLVISGLFVACSESDDYVDITETLLQPNEEFAGGETTVFDASSNAFEFSARNIANSDLTAFGVGNSLFEQNWVTAPASTTARDGLGPFFNARSCTTCHFKDGRGRTPEFSGELNHGLLLRLSSNFKNEFGEQQGDPIYGGQLQDQSILSVGVEAGFNISYEDQEITYPDGEVVTLRTPSYSITNLAYGALAANTNISPRIANHMVGLGLLEAIEENELIALADEFDTDNDGISGKINKVWNYETSTTSVGRFGWKANQPTIKQQVAAAFSGDLGITSSLFPNENCTEGVDCDSLVHGGNMEIEDKNLDFVTLYAATLAVPARRDYDTEATLRGKSLFFEAKCTACHVPQFTTGAHNISALENQLIFPYTDLLLHDMGAGLADNAEDFLANGNEWRTPPLWSIGLIQTVNGHTNLLHDGRARNVEEAILWHGGEAENSKQKFMSYTKEDRQLVTDFINTL